jgi:hypothetical protein
MNAVGGPQQWMIKLMGSGSSSEKQKSLRHSVHSLVDDLKRKE